MKYLFFDTETTGFPNPNYKPTSPLQAHIIQIAAILTDDKFNEIGRQYTLIKPAGWRIQEGAQKAHGISIEECEKHGIPIQDAILQFFSLAIEADASVAHNRVFDDSMLAIEFQNVGFEILAKTYPFSSSWLDEHKKYCTMNETTDLCKLPFPGGKKRYGQNYKWPKLIEAYQYCFNSTFDKAHDALADVEACKKIFIWLVEKGRIKLPNTEITLA